ncbi:MAG: hypothetical protein SFX72_07180 [Isosphaeraceae bacterium]|nr:hypothetical protein [Isosphaeraceae bacterium]
MSELDKPVGRIHRHLRIQRFLSALVWSLSIWLLAAVGVLAAKRLGYAIPGAEWWPFAIAGVLSIVTATIAAVTGGARRIDAAVAIDRAFELDERLSTAITLPAEIRETPAGRAVIRDAIRHVSDLDLGSKFRFRLPRRSWIPVVPALMALAVLFAPQWTSKLLAAKSGGTIAPKIDPKVVAKKSDLLSKKLAAQRKELDKTKFAEAEKLLAEIEKAARDLAKAPPAEKDKALLALNKLTKQLEDRQKQIGNPDQMNRQLRQLTQMNDKGGPAEKLAKDLARGEFQKAAQEAKQLQDKLREGKLTEQEKKQLQKQLDDLSKQIDKAANMEERKKQLDEALKNGGLSPEQHKQEMNKLEQQQKSMQDLKELANKLQQAQESLSKGDMQKAADALGMSEQQLQEMAEKLQEMESLDEALADLQEAKNGMTGEGDGEMEGNQFGKGMGRFGRNGRNSNNGQGLGRGRGEGDRPEAPDDTAAFDTKVKQQYTKGKAVIEGSGPPSAQMKGKSLVGIQDEIETAAGAAADALTNQKVPRSFENHIRGYFDRLNDKGSPASPDAPAPR